MLSCTNCPRGRKDCQPLSNIVSDSDETFVCCGKPDPESRARPQDEYRVCFRSVDTDSMFDLDERDMKHQLSVMADGLAMMEMLKDRK